MKHIILVILITLGVWGQEVGKPFAYSIGKESTITALALTKDEKTLFAGSSTGSLYRIELSPVNVTFGVNVGIHSKQTIVYPINGQPYETTTSSGTYINHLVLSPDERYVVTCGADKLLKAWDTQNGKLLQTFIGHQAPIKGAVILPDNKTLISADENMTIKYWDITSGKEIKSFAVNARAGDFNHDPEILYNLYLSNNGKILIVYDSYRIGFIDVTTGKVMNEYRHKGNFWANSSYFHNDILYVLRDGFILEYDVGNYRHMTDSNTSHIDKNKVFTQEQERLIYESCITNDDDILTILLYLSSMNSNTDITSIPVINNNLKIYGKNGLIVIDECPQNNNMQKTELFGHV